MTSLYLVLLITALLIGSFGWSKNLTKLNTTLTWLFLYLFSIFIGFRSLNSGVDTISYFNYFNAILLGEQTDFSFEKGFELFTYVLTVIGNAEFYVFLLSFLQLLLLLISARILKIKNNLIVLVLFLSFLPGLDMLTNGVRGGLALALGLPILIITAVNRNKFKILNFIPMIIHSSYGIIALISLLINKFSSVKLNIFLFIANIILFAMWLILTPLSLLGYLETFSSDSGLIGKLVRYLLIDKQLMSLSVKLYFMFVSISFSVIYFLCLKLNRAVYSDVRLTRIVFITLAGQFLYALISFSEYSYRFMYLVYPLQILMLSYVVDKYMSGSARNILIFFICALGISLTYSTKTFYSFELLSL